MDETVTASSAHRNHKRSKRGLGLVLLTLVVLILVAVSAFLAWKYNDARKEVKRLQNPQVAVKRESDELNGKVGQLIDLPKEQPTIATVSDVSKLKGQAFFAKAENGDKVLIFPNARRAVLYRPSTNKVIEYAPINIGNTNQ